MSKAVGFSCLYFEANILCVSVWFRGVVCVTAAAAAAGCECESETFQRLVESKHTIVHWCVETTGSCCQDVSLRTNTLLNTGQTVPANTDMDDTLLRVFWQTGSFWIRFRWSKDLWSANLWPLVSRTLSLLCLSDTRCQMSHSCRQILRQQAPGHRHSKKSSTRPSDVEAGHQDVCLWSFFSWWILDSFLLLHSFAVVLCDVVTSWCLCVVIFDSVVLLHLLCVVVFKLFVVTFSVLCCCFAPVCTSVWSFCGSFLNVCGHFAVFGGSCVSVEILSYPGEEFWSRLLWDLSVVVQLSSSRLLVSVLRLCVVVHFLSLTSDFMSLILSNNKYYFTVTVTEVHINPSAQHILPTVCYSDKKLE